MTHGHEHQREVLAHLFADLAAGSGAALRAACAPDVSWWLPFGDQHHGVAEVERALLPMFSGTTAQLQCVILSADGSSAVLEHLLHLEERRTTPATSVVTVREDRVVEGRTYLDVAAWSDRREVDHA